MLKSNNN